jgi:hypothetical protein
MCVLPLELEIETIKIELELVLATANDLKEIDFYKELPGEEYVPVYKRKLNLPIWLKSFKTDTIEAKCYFIREHTNMADISVFLKDNRVFIHKDFKM